MCLNPRGNLFRVLAVLALFSSLGNCGTNEFLQALQNSGLGFWATLLRETGLAETFAKGRMARDGTFLVPTDAVLENAYHLMNPGGGMPPDLQWLNWARKVIQYHFLEGGIIGMASDDQVFFPVYPPGSFLRVTITNTRVDPYQVRASTPSGEYVDFSLAGGSYQSMSWFPIDKVLLPKGIEPPYQIVQNEPTEPIQFPVYNNTPDFLRFLTEQGHNKLVELLNETQLATTFAQDDMSRFGTLFAPSDSAIENAYQQAMDHGANHSEWLDWASKVVPYHFVDNVFIDMAKPFTNVYFPESPLGSFLQVSHQKISGVYEITTDADPPQVVEYLPRVDEVYKYIAVENIDAVLVPRAYPKPWGDSQDEYLQSNSTAALSREQSVL